ncbi:MAG: putative sensor protein [Acidimicrobiaceae bacterium]|nr:putative sensor protein [Acidimicrobiaceae bacterium]
MRKRSARPGAKGPGFRLELPSEPASAGAARRWLEAVLAGEPPEFVHAASLALTEAVTNVVLHAGTSMVVRADLGEDRLRLEVTDGDRRGSPLLRRPGDGASTGRGLLLVDAIASSWGVDRMPSGKTVWFELGRPPDLVAPLQARVAETARTPAAETFGEDPSSTELVTIHLLGLPLGLRAHANEQYGDLFREFWFMASAPVDPSTAFPRHLVELMGDVGIRYRGFARQNEDRIAEAAARGESEVDLEHRLPAAFQQVWAVFDATLDEAEALCREERLTLSGVPDTASVAFRKWIGEEIRHQISGALPKRWTDSAWSHGLGEFSPAGRAGRRADIGRLLVAERAAKRVVDDAEHWMSGLRESAAKVLTSVSLEPMLGEALQALGESLEAAATFLLLAEPERGELIVRAVGGAGVQATLVGLRPLWGAPERAVATGEPVLGDLPVGASKACGLPAGTYSCVAVPLFLEGQVGGALCAVNADPGHFTKDDEAVAAVLGDTLAPALSRVRRFEQERSARLRAERSARQLHGLQAITSALARAEDLEEMCRVVVDETPRGIDGRPYAAVFALHGDRLHLVAGPDPAAQRFRELALDESTAAIGWLQHGRPSFAESPEESASSWPALLSAQCSAFGAFPLMVGQRALGLLVVGFDEAHAFDEGDRAFLLAVAEQLAVAIDRAGLRSAERRAHELRSFLADATLALSLPSTGEDDVLQRLAELAVPVLADMCAVLLPVGSHLDRVAIAWDQRGGLRPAEQPTLHGPGAADPVRSAGPAVRTAMRTGRATLCSAAPGEALADPVAAEVGAHSAMVVPLALADHRLGVMVFAAGLERPAYAIEELELAKELAARAALVAEEALARGRDRAFAASVVRAIRPGRLPTLPGVELCARYLPAESGAVGGDWYDVFELPGDRLGLVVGDVAGHGVAASAAMARLRNALFAFANEGRRPSEVVSSMAAVMGSIEAEESELSLMASVKYATYDAVSRCFEVANAGHPPFVAARDGRRIIGKGGGRVLLPGLAPLVAEQSWTLERGDLLLMFTDGLIERAGESIEVGIDRLADAACALAQGIDLQEACDRLVASALLDVEQRRDDCCLLAMRIVE